MYFDLFICVVVEDYGIVGLEMFDIFCFIYLSLIVSDIRFGGEGVGNKVFVG